MSQASSTAQEIEQDPRRGVTLDQVVGHDDVRAYLQRACRQGQLPQAILLTGPAGIGKTTLAWALVRQIIADDGDPATHPQALKVQRGVHPDVIELTGKGSISAQIKVDDIRAMEDRAWTSPLEASRKIVLIDPADRMNASSANSLLKLLEEPPPHLVLILVTDEAGRLLTTIRSRCAWLSLEPVGVDRLAQWLVGRTRMDAQQAGLVARLAEGRPGEALRLGEAEILGRREQLLGLLQRLRDEGFAVLFQVADGFAGAARGLDESLTMATGLLRDALVLQAGGDEILSPDLEAPLRRLAECCSAGGLLEAGEALEAAAREAPFFFTPQARAHFIESVLADVGRLLRA